MERKYGRIEYFDKKSKRYSIGQLLGSPKRDVPLASNKHNCPIRIDQLNTSSCVGHGWTHLLATKPHSVSGVDHKFALELYHDAQRNDPWEGGEYPGALKTYKGSTVLGGAKACLIRGLIGYFFWGFGLYDTLLGISKHDSVVLGTKWYEGMARPDTDGRIRPTGSVLGGHCYVGDEISVENKRVWVLNSHGTDYGINGRAWMTWDDFGDLLDQGGEACFALGRRTEPMKKDSYL